MRIGDILSHQMANAATNGIQIVFHEVFLLKSNFTAGTKISAITQGRIPLKIRSTIAFSLNEVKNMEISKIMMNEGSAAPNTETMAPRLPRSL